MLLLLLLELLLVELLEGLLEPFFAFFRFTFGS